MLNPDALSCGIAFAILAASLSSGETQIDRQKWKKPRGAGASSLSVHVERSDGAREKAATALAYCYSAGGGAVTLSMIKMPHPAVRGPRPDQSTES